MFNFIFGVSFCGHSTNKKAINNYYSDKIRQSVDIHAHISWCATDRQAELHGKHTNFANWNMLHCESSSVVNWKKWHLNQIMQARTFFTM